ncbi:MAG: hypothetical protein AB1556_07040 [Bacillota bacterium]
MTLRSLNAQEAAAIRKVARMEMISTRRSSSRCSSTVIPFSLFCFLLSIAFSFRKMALYRSSPTGWNCPAR